MAARLEKGSGSLDSNVDCAQGGIDGCVIIKHCLATRIQPLNPGRNGSVTRGARPRAHSSPKSGKG